MFRPMKLSPSRYIWLVRARNARGSDRTPAPGPHILDQAVERAAAIVAAAVGKVDAVTGIDLYQREVVLQPASPSSKSLPVLLHHDERSAGIEGEAFRLPPAGAATWPSCCSINVTSHPAWASRAAVASRRYPHPDGGTAPRRRLGADGGGEAPARQGRCDVSHETILACPGGSGAYHATNRGVGHRTTEGLETDTISAERRMARTAPRRPTDRRRRAGGGAQATASMPGAGLDQPRVAATEGDGTGLALPGRFDHVIHRGRDPGSAPATPTHERR
jgi:hypothetical protein